MRTPLFYCRSLLPKIPRIVAFSAEQEKGRMSCKVMGVETGVGARCPRPDEVAGMGNRGRMVVRYPYVGGRMQYAPTAKQGLQVAQHTGPRRTAGRNPSGTTVG